MKILCYNNSEEKDLNDFVSNVAYFKKGEIKMKKIAVFSIIGNSNFV